MKWWFTFGQDHTHRVNGVTFDCDIVLEIEGTASEARQRMTAALNGGDK